MINFDFKYAEEHLLLKTISGSKVYGLDLPTSDTDIRGIFLQPNEYRLGNGYKEQVNDNKNDIVYYELNRFINLLSDNNPNIIEILFTPKDKILRFDPRIKPLYDNRDKFLTKKIRLTFGGYAISQIQKARGLNKKIVNPMDKKKKIPLDFCYIFDKEDGYMMLATQWLKKNKKKQNRVGLAEMPNGVQLYKLYYYPEWIDKLSFSEKQKRFHYDLPIQFKGIVSENGNELLHSEIPKQYPLTAFLFFNKNGYSTYCKDYKEYWDWVDNRNPHRYNDNINNKHNYDGKNMMHCLRILDIAIEIAEGKGVNLIRPNREWLLSVRKGLIEYDEIIQLIEEKRKQLDEMFLTCNLPDNVDEDMVQEIILKIRNN